MSIAEEEVGGIGVDNIVGQPVAWNYYETIDTPENKKFVQDFKTVYGADKVDLGPDGGRLHLALPLEGHGREGRTRSRSPDVQAAAGGVTFAAPEGTVTVNGDNHHIAKTALIGKIAQDGLIYTDLVVGQADRARPVPQDLPLGRSQR